MSEEGTRRTSEPRTTTVEIPTRLVSSVEARLPATRFDTPDGYVAYVLEEVLATVEEEAGADDIVETVDESEVQARLESLGYLE